MNVHALGAPRPRWTAIKSFVAASLLVVAGCYPTELTSMRVVPGAMALPGVSHLLLGNFAGPGGQGLAQAVAQELLRRRSYAVSDVGAMPLAAWQQRDRYVPHDVRVGLGSDAWLEASVTRHDVDDTYSYAEHLEADGSVATTYARSGVAAVVVQFTAIDPHSGALFDSHSVAVEVPLEAEQVTVWDRATAEPGVMASYFAPRDPTSAFAAAYAAAAEAFCDAVAVRYAPVRLSVWHAQGDFRSQRAVDAITHVQWGTALQIYQEQLALAERSGVSDELRAKAHYNLGVAYAMSGAWAQGQHELMLSQALDNNRLVQAELDRVQMWLWEAQRPRG